MSEDSIQEKSSEVTEEKKQEDQFVSRKAYQEVSTDMHNYKNTNKDLKAELEKLRADEATRVESEQVKNGEFQALADSYKQKFEESEASRQAEKARVVDLNKMQQISEVVGGFQRSEYAQLAVNLENIKLDENGLIDRATLDAEAVRIKQDHPHLIRSSKGPQLPNEAAGTHSTPLAYKDAIKACKTQEELTALMDKHGRL